MPTSKSNKKTVSIETLQEEHRALEKRLNELNEHAYLTPAEQVERMTIKKLKLLKKDQIAILTRQANA